MALEDGLSKTMRIDIPPDYYTKRRPRAQVKIAHPTTAAAGVSAAHDARRTSGEIAVQNADLSELFQNVYDAAFITDMTGNIIDANVRASQFFGYSHDEFLVGTIMDIVVGLNEAMLATVCENLRNDRFTLIQTQCARKDGTLMPTEISTCKLTLSKKPFLCFFIRDITARKEAENELKLARDELQQEVQERARINAELQKAIERLQEHDKAKSQFVSNVSHELKTPLSSINYVAGNMIKGIAGPVTEHGKAYLEMIREDCQRLRRTVDDILDMSRIESNTLRLNKVKVNFGRFMHRTIESLRLQIEAEGLKLDIDVKANGFVECDPQKMERVIFNVVKNAMKYNVTDGFIKVVLRASEDMADCLILDIIDCGIGIEPEFLPRIAERFFRVGEYVSGTGLGLAICKDLVERHGGKIDVKSPPDGMNKGTQVSIYLPIVPPPLALVAYEDEQVRLALTTHMDEYGYNVVAGRLSDGSLHAAFQGGKVDLIAVEWIQKGMDGGIIVAMLKGEETVAHVPMLAVTDIDPALPKKEILDGFDIPRMTVGWKKEDLWNCIDELVLGRKRLDV